MSTLLVLETSTALVNLLKRTLSSSAMDELEVVTDATRLTTAFERALAQPNRYRAVIAGIPQRDFRVAHRWRSQVEEAGDRPPIVFLIHESDPQFEAWAERHADLALMRWQRFGRIPGLLDELAPRTGPSIDVSADGEQPPIKILFIDDSQSVRYTYRQMLEQEGYVVATAASVSNALEQANQHDFDLIIVDFYLPDGTGDELCAKLSKHPRSRHATLAIITGSYRESIIKKCLEAGAIECMFKNEAKELFLTRVRSLAQLLQTSKSVDAERQRLEGILASVGDGVYGVDRDGKVTFMNPTGLRILGFSTESALIGKHAKGLFHGREEETLELNKAYASGDQKHALETVMRRTDGERVPVECTVFPLAVGSEHPGSVIVFRNISERKTAEQLRWEAAHDELTGALNRRAFSQVLEKALERLRTQGGQDALLYIDLDHFDDVIEYGGAKLGDRLLAEVAQKFAAQLRDNDSFARIEDDKFAILLSGIQLQNLLSIADNFSDQVALVRYEMRGNERTVAASVGVAILSRNTPSAEYALENARIGCKHAKRHGQNQTYIYVPEEDVRIARELDAGFVQRFQDAIRGDQFVFLAQPIVPVASIPDAWRGGDAFPLGPNQELICELLLRMVARDGQWISPSVFVPIAERVGMMQDIDLWVVRQALAKLAYFQRERLPISFTVNLSNLTLQDPEALERMFDAFENYPVAPSQLIFEITETAEIESLHAARKFMMELRKVGCRFALDDFGTGFSSFSHLKHLPIDFIKVDGTFVEEMGKNEVDRTVVQSIVGLSRALRLQTIAEHVNSDASLSQSRELGVDYAQGHLFGEPKPLEAFETEVYGETRALINS